MSVTAVSRSISGFPSDSDSENDDLESEWTFISGTFVDSSVSDSDKKDLDLCLCASTSLEISRVT